MVRGSAATAVGLLSGKLFEYLNRLLVARLFNPELFGLYSLSIAVLNLGIVLSSFGFNTAIPRFVAEHEAAGETGKTKGVLLFSLLVLVPLSLGVSAAIYFGADLIGRRLFSKEELTPLLRLAAPIIPLGTLLLIGVGYLRGRQKFLLSALYNNTVLRFVFFLTLILLYLSGKVSMAGVFIGLGAGYLISAGLSLAQAGGIPVPVRADWKQAPMLGYSWPLALSTIFIQFATRCDLYVMGYFMVGAELGYFNACHTLAALILLPQTFVNRAVLPVMSGLCGQKDLSAIKDIYESIVFWLAILSVPVIFGFVLYSRELIALFFGDQYLFESLPLVAGILAVGNLIGLLAGPNGVLLLSLGETRLEMNINITSALIGLMSAVLLIWLFGIVGAAAASSLYVVVSNVAGIYFVKRRVPGLRFGPRLIKTLIGGALALAASLCAGVLLGETTPVGKVVVPTVFVVAYAVFLGRMHFSGRADFSAIWKPWETRRT